MVNELVTNALKHAFPPGRPGQVTVRLSAKDAQAEVQVRDNGKGLPADFDLEHSKSLGLRLVNILAQRLHATVGVADGDGTCFTIGLPLEGES